MQLDPFPSNPVHGPLQFPAKLRQGSLKKKKKKRHTTHTVVIYYYYFFLTLMLASVLEYEARVGKVVPGLVRP